MFCECSHSGGKLLPGLLLEELGRRSAGFGFGGSAAGAAGVEGGPLLLPPLWSAPQDGRLCCPELGTIGLHSLATTNHPMPSPALAEGPGFSWP